MLRNKRECAIGIAKEELYEKDRKDVSQTHNGICSIGIRGDSSRRNESGCTGSGKKTDEDHFKGDNKEYWN
jgi:hypothetical protein